MAANPFVRTYLFVVVVIVLLRLACLSPSTTDAHLVSLISLVSRSVEAFKPLTSAPVRRGSPASRIAIPLCLIL